MEEGCCDFIPGFCFSSSSDNVWVSVDWKIWMSGLLLVIVFGEGEEEREVAVAAAVAFDEENALFFSTRSDVVLRRPRIDETIVVAIYDKVRFTCIL